MNQNEFIKIPIGDINFFMNRKGVKKFWIDCVPLTAIRSANRDLFIDYNEHPNYVDFIEPQGKLKLTGFKSKWLHKLYEKMYVYIPGMHHITWSDMNIVHLDYDIQLKYHKFNFRDVELKAFVAVSDVVNVGISLYDRVMLQHMFLIRRIGRNQEEAVLSGAGLPDPIPTRMWKFTIYEDMYEDLKKRREYIFERRRKERIHTHSVLPESNNIMAEWVHNLISPEIGTYDFTKYIVNYRAMFMHPDIYRWFRDCLWLTPTLMKVYSANKNKLYRGKLKVDLNRILIKR